ncbi:MAG: transposase [Moorea sp. SIO1F2]|uniref:IS66 family transposase n=1 Tax=Moorena sp. SIO1F2 TaxID=2607819 RepID=UPI0013BE7E52|nr:transposase [Moorena sp. SIO1F2]NET85185.1 transposase [Moorena sp. SIO1F2]
MSKAQKTPEFDLKQIRLLPTEQLVDLIVQQHQVIEELQQEILRLKLSLQKDRQTSSKPPSTDLLKKPEKPKVGSDKTCTPKGQPGGQPGHPGKTRKGFERVDRYERLLPQKCPHCSSVEFIESPVSVQRQQVAQLVAHPIEVVHKVRLCNKCAHCGQLHTAPWPKGIVPGQDLSVGLQSLLVRHSNYGHLSYDKQQELLWELGNIEVGVGSLVSTNARVAKAVKGSVDELREWVKRQPRVHVDQTPWPVLGH